MKGVWAMVSQVCVPELEHGDKGDVIIEDVFVCILVFGMKLASIEDYEFAVTAVKGEIWGLSSRM